MSERNKLIATAAGAALLGAGVAISILKYSAKQANDERDNNNNNIRQASTNNNLTNSFALYEDPEASRNILFPHNHEEKMKVKIAARTAVEEDYMVPRKSVTVRVPATSANLGPGCTYRIVHFRIYFFLEY
jgi:hypothetical protein